MNIITTVIKSRHSVRKFKPEGLDEMAIKDALECAAQAPTAMNIQPWLFGVIKDKDLLQKIADCTEHGKFIKDCATCFAIFGEKKETYYLEDCCAATENLILALQAYGISSCWVAGNKKHYAESIREILEVPEKYTLVSLIAAGIPLEITITKKKDMKHVVFSEQYDKKN
jgi:nitroreductase